MQVWVQTEWWGDFQCFWSRQVPDPDEHEEESAEQLIEDTPGDAPPGELLGPTTYWLYRGPGRKVVR